MEPVPEWIWQDMAKRNTTTSDTEFAPGKGSCSSYVTWFTEINYYFPFPPNSSKHDAGAQLHKQHPVCGAYRR